MEGYEKVLESSKLPPGSMKTVELNGDTILLANAGGRYFGIHAVCKHEEWDLSEGVLDGTKVTCAGHGAIWDLETGVAEFDEPLDEEPLYDVRLEGAYLYVKRRS